MIIKVQTALAGNTPGPWILAYNEDRSAIYHGPAPPAVYEAMGGQVKAFFYATLKNGDLKIGDDAPWQEW